MTAGQDHLSHSAPSGAADEWMAAATDLAAAAEAYDAQYFGRILSREDVMAAVEEISVIQDAANRLHTVWRTRLAALPSRQQLDGVADTVLQVGTRGTVGWMWHVFKATDDRAESVRVMRDFERISNDGYEILRLISPTLPYAIHLEGETTRAADPGDEESTSLQAAAINARQTIEVNAANIDRDIESQRSQVQLLTSYTQTSMTEEVRGLTRALTLLTLVVVLLTVGALVTSALNASGH